MVVTTIHSCNYIHSHDFISIYSNAKYRLCSIYLPSFIPYLNLRKLNVSKLFCCVCLYTLLDVVSLPRVAITRKQAFPWNDQGFSLLDSFKDKFSYHWSCQEEKLGFLSSKLSRQEPASFHEHREINCLLDQRPLQCCSQVGVSQFT